MAVYRDKRRGTYYYKFVQDGKTYRSRDFPDRYTAEKAYMKAKSSAGETERMTFSEVAEVFLAEKKPRLKVQSYDRLETMLDHFLATLGGVYVDKLTVSQYQSALQYLDEYQFHGKSLKNSYKNKVIRTFKQLCTFAGRRYDLHTNVPDKFDPYPNERKEEMHFITQDQLEQLLSVVDNRIYHALFITLFYMGFRLGEANALQWSDVDFDSGTISVSKTVTTKVQKDSPFLITTPKTEKSYRTLPMPQIVSNELLGLHECFPYPKQKLASAFVFGGLRPIPETTMQQKKNNYFKMAQLEPIRLHDFRHSCASFLVNNGATPLLVSKWLGHSNVSMTLDTYSHLWSSSLDEIVSIINSNNRTQIVRKPVQNTKKP